MSERSAAIGLASASSLAPPPNNSAEGFAMKDHVTASTRPRDASARLARRVRNWMGLRIGLRGSSPRGNGDLHHGAAAGYHEAEVSEDALHLGKRHVDAGKSFDFVKRKIDHAIVA